MWTLYSKANGRSFTHADYSQCHGMFVFLWWSHPSVRVKIFQFCDTVFRLIELNRWVGLTLKQLCLLMFYSAFPSSFPLVCALSCASASCSTVVSAACCYIWGGKKANCHQNLFSLPSPSVLSPSNSCGVADSSHQGRGRRQILFRV